MTAPVDALPGDRQLDAGPPPPSASSERDEPDRPPISGRRIAFLIGLWLVVAGLAMGIVVYALEPLFQQRAQASRLEEYRIKVDQAAKESLSLSGVTTPIKAPDLGESVGVLEIPVLGVQQVVVEGVAPPQTQAGPGHVPGTAGLGQPGNSVVLGRRSTFGAPFADLSQLQSGDEMLVTTTQGQSVYKVDAVREQNVSTPEAPDATATQPAADSAGSSLGGDAQQEDPTTAGDVQVDVLYGATKDDRLTLLTSASALPWNSSKATVVTAKLRDKPFAPTPQGGRTDSQTGLTGDATAWAPVLLALIAYGATVAAVIVLYDRSSLRVAYLLTLPPLLAFTVVAAETTSRMFPGWL